MRKPILTALIAFAAIFATSATFAQEIDKDVFVDFQKNGVTAVAADANALKDVLTKEGEFAEGKVWLWGVVSVYPDGAFYCYYGGANELNGATLALATYATKDGVANGLVVLNAIDSDAPLAKAGVKQGDVIASVDGKAVNGVGDIDLITEESKVEVVKGDALNVAKKVIPARVSVMATGEPLDSASAGEIAQAADAKTVVTLYEFVDLYDAFVSETTDENGLVTKAADSADVLQRPAPGFGGPNNRRHPPFPPCSRCHMSHGRSLCPPPPPCPKCRQYHYAFIEPCPPSLPHCPRCYLRHPRYSSCPRPYPSPLPPCPRCHHHHQPFEPCRP